MFLNCFYRFYIDVNKHHKNHLMIIAQSDFKQSWSYWRSIKAVYYRQGF